MPTVQKQLFNTKAWIKLVKNIPTTITLAVELFKSYGLLSVHQLSTDRQA